MKRDFELVRQILMLAESGGDLSRFVRTFGMKRVVQHLEWMIQADLVRGLVRKTAQDKVESFEIFEPTWQGLEFLANARDEDAWKRVMSSCSESSFGIVSAILHETALRKARASV